MSRLFGRTRGRVTEYLTPGLPPTISIFCGEPGMGDRMLSPCLRTVARVFQHGWPRFRLTLLSREWRPVPVAFGKRAAAGRARESRPAVQWGYRRPRPKSAPA